MLVLSMKLAEVAYEVLRNFEHPSSNESIRDFAGGDAKEPLTDELCDAINHHLEPFIRRSRRDPLCIFEGQYEDEAVSLLDAMAGFLCVTDIESHRMTDEEHRGLFGVTYTDYATIATVRAHVCDPYPKPNSQGRNQYQLLPYYVEVLFDIDLKSMGSWIAKTQPYPHNEEVTIVLK